MPNLPPATGSGGRTSSRHSCHHIGDEGRGQLSYAYILMAGSHRLPHLQGQLYCAAGRMPAFLSAASGEMPVLLRVLKILGPAFPPGTGSEGQGVGKEIISPLLRLPCGR